MKIYYLWLRLILLSNCNIKITFSLVYQNNIEYRRLEGTEGIEYNSDIKSVGHYSPCVKFESND